MENKDYINEIIGYLKDDRPAHANTSMKKYMRHLGYFEYKIGEETTNIQRLLHEKYVKINELQQKLDEQQQKNINEVLAARKGSKVMYYIGLLTGLTGIIVGVFINNILYVFPGIAISIISIVGLYEAKKNTW